MNEADLSGATQWARPGKPADVTLVLVWHTVSGKKKASNFWQ